MKSIAECLADELINAAKVSLMSRGVLFVFERVPYACMYVIHGFICPQGSSNSYAIKKKDELERVAKSNR